MVIQASITENMAEAFAGQWYDISDTEAVSRTCQFSAIPFGVAVVKGTNDNQIRLPDAAGIISDPATTEADNPYIGIVMFHSPLARVALKNPIADGVTGYLAVTETASMATQGRIWVMVDSDVALGDDVYYRATLSDASADPQPQALGTLGNTDDGGNCILIPGAQFMMTKSAGEMSVVKLTGA